MLEDGEREQHGKRKNTSRDFREDFSAPCGLRMYRRSVCKE